MSIANIKEEISQDILRIADGSKELGRGEYLSKGKFTYYQLYDNGMDWDKWCRLVGISTKAKKSVTDEEYFERLKDFYNAKGRYPKQNERKGLGLNFTKKRFPTLTLFIKEAIKKEYVPNLYKNSDKILSDDKRETSIQELIIKTIKQNNTGRVTPPIARGTKRKKWTLIPIPGFPYAPQEEQGVLAIFSILCSKHIFPWQILDISTNGIDIICYDENEAKEIKVELKYILSRGSWNHNMDDLDYLVCWENRWNDFPKEVIELSKLILEPVFD